MATQKSSSTKVGFLTLISITILILTVLWIKGRSLSVGERIEIAFRDANGIRAGAGVQIMGLRVGQIEEVTPVIDGENSRVKIKFVITEKGIKIPELSQISIQQSGIIGEQFLEITPPQVQNVYISSSGSSTKLKEGDDVYMKFNNELKNIGKIVDSENLSGAAVPHEVKDRLKTQNVTKISYLINLPGLILDNSNLDGKIAKGSLVLNTIDGEVIPYPEQTGLPYTIIEPMRLSEFMDLQFKAARSLNQAGDRVSAIISDDLIYEIQQGAKNINELTSSALTTVEKAQKLIDNSKDDLEVLFKQSTKLTTSLTELSNSVNEIVSDKNLKSDLLETAKSIRRLSNNVNDVLEREETKEIIENMDEISRNVNDITTYVNEFTKDEKLKKDITSTVSSISSVTKSLNETLAEMNALPQGEKVKLSNVLSDAVVTSRNLRKFSEKLNKRFLLFRLMF